MYKHFFFGQNTFDFIQNIKWITTIDISSMNTKISTIMVRAFHKRIHKQDKTIFDQKKLENMSYKAFCHKRESGELNAHRQPTKKRMHIDKQFVK